MNMNNRRSEIMPTLVRARRANDLQFRNDYV